MDDLSGVYGHCFGGGSLDHMGLVLFVIVRDIGPQMTVDCAIVIRLYATVANQCPSASVPGICQNNNELSSRTVHGWDNSEPEVGHI